MAKKPTGRGLTRRHMLAAMSASAVATAAEAGPVRLGSFGSKTAAAADLNRGNLSDWSALVGQRFRIAGASGAPLKLVSVEPVNSAGPRPGAVRRRRGFAAVFETSMARAPEGDQAYWIAQGMGAPLPVFLSPPAEVSGKARLVAVFN